MADTEEKPKAEIPKSENPNLSFSIWPPTQRTRDAVVSRLIETLSTPSVLSKRYGTIPEAEAAVTARQIEEEAFATTSASADDDGIEILQGYSKEISKRMLETVKSRSGGVSSESALEGGAAADVKSEEVEIENTEIANNADLPNIEPGLDDLYLHDAFVRNASPLPTNLGSGPVAQNVEGKVIGTRNVVAGEGNYGSNDQDVRSAVKGSSASKLLEWNEDMSLANIAILRKATGGGESSTCEKGKGKRAVSPIAFVDPTKKLKIGPHVPVGGLGGSVANAEREKNGGYDGPDVYRHEPFTDHESEQKKIHLNAYSWDEHVTQTKDTVSRAVDIVSSFVSRAEEMKENYQEVVGERDALRRRLNEAMRKANDQAESLRRQLDRSNKHVDVLNVDKATLLEEKIVWIREKAAFETQVLKLKQKLDEKEENELRYVELIDEKEKVISSLSDPLAKIQTDG